MEFGRVPEKELKKINFDLPEEPAFNKKVLKGKALKNPKIYVGCAKWGRPDWVGTLYPPRTREKDFLKFYVDHYNSIELNATHYKLYGPIGIRKWAAFAGKKDFLFCPKMYKGTTHAAKLNAKPFLTNEFFRGIQAFGKHLGPVFIQVNEKFTPRRKAELISFLTTLPGDIQYFLEVRHPAWFSDKETTKELFEFLREHSLGAVITDTAGRRDCAHMHLPVSKTFIRFVGNSLHPTDYSRIDDWVQRMKYWLDRGLKELYFFMHMHDEATSPELSVYLLEQMNEVCGLDLHVPQFFKKAIPGKN